MQGVSAISAEERNVNMLAATGRLLNNVLSSKWVILLPFALYLALAIGRSYTAFPWVDEGYFASPSVNLVRHGFMGTTVCPAGTEIGAAGLMPGIQSHTYWLPPLYFLAEALTFRLFGIGLLQARFVSIFWGFVGLVAIYYLAKKLFNNDRKLVVLSVSLLAVDPFWLGNASLARMDMMAASLSLVALAGYLTLREKNLAWAIFWGNLFVCLSGLTHPNGLLGLLALIFIIVYLDRRRLRPSMVGVGLIPYALGAIGWGAYIIRDFESFKDQFFGNVHAVNTFGWTEFISGFKGYFSAYGFLSLSRSTALAPILLLFLMGLIGAPLVARRKHLIWGALVIVFLGTVLLIGSSKFWYMGWVPPFFILNSIAVLESLRERKLAKVFFSLAFCYIVIVSIAYSVRAVTVDSYHNEYLHDLRQFNSQSYQGGQIYGSSEMAFFYGFRDDVIQDDSGGLGFETGVKPQHFVVSGYFTQTLEDLMKDDPAKHDYIVGTLKTEYTEVFRGSHYTFYERKAE